MKSISSIVVFLVVLSCQQPSEPRERADVQFKGKEQKDQLDAAVQSRIESTQNLEALYRVLSTYSRDHRRRYPDSLQEIEPYLKNGHKLQWFMENVEYLGKGVETRCSSRTPIAFDRTLLEKGYGSAFLLNDGRVELMSNRDLERLGISPGQGDDVRVKFIDRVASAVYLRYLRIALLVYGADFEFPDSLAMLRIYGHMPKRSDYSWFRQNVEYLGKGKRADKSDEAPIAYDKRLLAKHEGTTVLFTDLSVHFKTLGQFRGLGIKIGDDLKEEKNSERDDIQKSITLRIFDAAGHPVAGALADNSMRVRNSQWEASFRADREGKLVINEDEILGDWNRDGKVLFYSIAASNQAGFLEFSKDDLGSELEVRLEPACEVYGTVKSSELEKIGTQLSWWQVAVVYGKHRPINSSGESGWYDLILPPGKYRLVASGRHAYYVEKQIEVKSGQLRMEVNFDLPVDRFFALRGKSAPEFRGLKGWINNEEVRLSDLHGKVVLLCFWDYRYSGVCREEIRNLIEFYDKYNKHGLEIVAIHSSEVGSIGELREKVDELLKKDLKDRDIPFPMALDGGSETEIEDTGRKALGTTAAAYGIGWIPATVLVDRNGIVVKGFAFEDPRDIEQIERMLGI